MIDRDVFNYYKFKNSYNIIGDFDFIIRASLKFKIGCIQEPLILLEFTIQIILKKMIYKLTSINTGF